MRALISVYDKHGIDTLRPRARGARLRARLLGRHRDVPRGARDSTVTRVEDVTGAPEMLGGRVKTLHPAIHAGILARRDLEEDRATLAEHGIEPFDLVCVNLYPFLSLAGRIDVDEADIIEMIDVGGPSLLRGAAKNFAHVAPVCRPEQYDPVLAELSGGGALAETRRALAAEAFAVTAAYDAAIARWFAEDQFFPDQLTLTFRKITDLAVRREPAPDRRLLRGGRLAEAPALARRTSSAAASSRTTTSPTSRPRGASCASCRRRPPRSIVKHANPCGVAIAETIEHAYARALAADPVSAFGCVLMLNRPVEGGARQADRRALRRGRLRARVRRRGARGARRQAGAPDPPRPRAPGRHAATSATTSASSAACSCRSATRSPRRREGMEVVDGLGRRGAVGRPHVRLARLQARQLERDRARQGRPDDRHRRRPDEPRRRGPDRDREGAGARPRPGRRRCSRATRSSRSPTARSSRSTPASRRSSSRADRSATARRSRRSTAAGAAMVLTHAATSGTSHATSRQRSAVTRLSLRSSDPP